MCRHCFKVPQLHPLGTYRSKSSDRSTSDQSQATLPNDHISVENIPDNNRNSQEQNAPENEDPQDQVDDLVSDVEHHSIQPDSHVAEFPEEPQLDSGLKRSARDRNPTCFYRDDDWITDFSTTC